MKSFHPDIRILPNNGPTGEQKRILIDGYRIMLLHPLLRGLLQNIEPRWKTGLLPNVERFPLKDLTLRTFAVTEKLCHRVKVHQRARANAKKHLRPEVSEVILHWEYGNESTFRDHLVQACKHWMLLWWFGQEWPVDNGRRVFPPPVQQRDQLLLLAASHGIIVPDWVPQGFRAFRTPSEGGSSYRRFEPGEEGSDDASQAPQTDPSLRSTVPYASLQQDFRYHGDMSQLPLQIQDGSFPVFDAYGNLVVPHPPGSSIATELPAATSNEQLHLYSNPYATTMPFAANQSFEEVSEGYGTTTGKYLLQRKHASCSRNFAHRFLFWN